MSWRPFLRVPHAVLKEFTMQIATRIREDAPTLDIVDAAIAAGHFSMLVNAVKAAGLVETLKGTGPFTVFAPTDAAFRKLPRDTMNGLLKDKAALAAILTFHVVAAKIMAKDVKSGDLATVQGENLKIVVSNDGIRINNSKVMKTDIETSNGVMHSIDTVLMPS
jgi:uncharacterized surface protein with fasciclin (FAS1) repeats